MQNAAKGINTLAESLPKLITIDLTEFSLENSNVCK